MPEHPDLRRHLRFTLPAYMVPSAFVELEELPRTPNGKLDHRRLPAPPAPGLSSAATGRSAAGGADASLTPLENQLLGIWRHVLGLENIGVDDDFFELGGHSLLAVRLLAAAQLELSSEIPLALLYEGPVTVRGMASAIEAVDGRREGTSPARLGTPPSGSANLFFVVPSETSLVALRYLRPLVGPEHAVVGLLAGHLGERFDRSKSIEERAASMLQSIVDVQGRGPYFLAGFSFGGLVAYEIATLLHEAGEHVSWLGLVNTRAPAAVLQRSKARARVARGLALGPRATAAALGRQARRLISSEQEDGIDVVGDFDGAGALAIGMRHAPRPNGITVDLFVSEQDSNLHGRSLGWETTHADLLRVHTIGSEHRVLLDQRNATALAREIRESLDRVR
jgi:thioesterase domain-containing protein